MCLGGPDLAPQGRGQEVGQLAVRLFDVDVDTAIV